jgi:uncharacterized protein
MMDVSGSMGEEQKEIVRIEAFWLDTWLRSQYKNIKASTSSTTPRPSEVDEHTFLSPARERRHEDQQRLPAVQQDHQRALQPRWTGTSIRSTSPTATTGAPTTPAAASSCLMSRSFPPATSFCYGQVRSAYGSGKFKEDLDQTAISGDERVITSDIANLDGIMDSIRDFLGKGK